jgi:hypothetical protein
LGFFVSERLQLREKYPQLFVILVLTFKNRGLPPRKHPLRTCYNPPIEIKGE